MKKIFIFIISFSILIISNASSDNQFLVNLVPGDGYTEASIQINEDDNPDLEILAVRDIDSSEYSNFFTQFSIHTQEINSSDRFITNVGLGYRTLNDDKTSMFGINTFFDYDLEGHQRGSIGIEARGAMFDLNANSYHKITNMEVVDGNEEQVLSGYEINLTSQLPYLPWSKLNLQNYSWEKEKASSDTEGNKLSLEMLITPSLQFDISGDFSDNAGVDDEYTYKLTFVHPPRDTKYTLKDGFISNLAFEKENVETKLKEKVRRSNNLTVEIQGAVIVTSK